MGVLADYVRVSLRDLANLVALQIALVVTEHSDCWVAEQMEEHCMVMAHGESWAAGGQADWKVTLVGRKYSQQMRASRAVNMNVKYL